MDDFNINPYLCTSPEKEQHKSKKTNNEKLTNFDIRIITLLFFYIV